MMNLGEQPPLPLSLPSDRAWGLMCALGRKAECRFEECQYPEHPATVRAPRLCDPCGVVHGRAAAE